MAEGPLRVLIEGQGALGTFFAASLAHEGHAVHVRSARAGDATRVELATEGRRRFEGPVTLSSHLPEGPFDAILLTSRASDALARADELVGHLSESGAILPVQNGLVPLDLLDALGPSRVAPCVVGFNARLDTPTTCIQTSPGGIVAGAEAEPAHRIAERVAFALHRQLPARTTANPRGAVWSKWCMSCAINGLAIVTGTGVQWLTERRAGRLALLGVVNECVEIARAEGITFERVAGPLTPDRLSGPSERGLGAALRHRMIGALGRRYRGVTPSSLDALQGGRDIELHALNERAVALGPKHAIATPWNEAIVAIAHEVVAGKRESGEDTFNALIERVA